MNRCDEIGAGSPPTAFTVLNSPSAVDVSVFWCKRSSSFELTWTGVNSNGR